MTRTPAPDAPLGRVDTMLASAGTGKTHGLVGAIEEAVAGGLDPARLLATTFTNRAADELAARIRERLVARGRADAASAMLGARIGTVNGVCGELLREFALELGRSPVAEVIPEERLDTLFARAVAPVMADFEHLGELAERFGMADARGRSRFGGAGWRDDVRKIAALARLNGIAADGLADAARRSLDGLLALLPAAAPGETAASLDDDLDAALAGCRADLTVARRAALKKTSMGSAEAVDRAHQARRRGEALDWPTWARLAKLAPAKADADLFLGVIEAAAAHPRHPRLRADLAAFVEGQFACAAACLPAFAAFKAANGLVDFVDQEELALRVLRADAHRERLAEAIGAVYVDEYQDSSPIQVALFAALARCAPASVWVGDPKQSIYRFRDADPALTTETARRITHDTGGATTTLRRSWRSRPGIVALVNAAFTPHFTRLGASEDEVAFDRAQRADPPDVPPALAVWDVAARSAPDRALALAGAIAGMLARPADWPVEPKGEPPRPLRGGDVGVLCRTNDQVRLLAGSLDALGVRTAVERPGLRSQPEVGLLVAALRWVGDRSDALAAVELARFAGPDGAWLDAAFAPEREEAVRSAVPFADELIALRDHLDHLTPAEMVDRVLHARGLLAAVRGWGDVERRLANLETVRALAAAYQEEQRTLRRAVSVAGLCAWIVESEAPQPASAHPDAVHLLTYHGAKGLEWPVVVLTELGSAGKASPFQVVAESLGETDWRDPLRGRTIRYWPNPYGSQIARTGIDEAAAESPAGLREAAAERLERVRLLYVGTTRARDYLVFARAEADDLRHWLNDLRDDDDRPIVSFADDAVLVGGRRFAARCVTPVAPDAGAAPAAPPEYAAPAAAPTIHPPRVLRPSAAPLQGTAAIAETARLGARLTLAGDPDMRALGEACHGFFACDDAARPSAWRTARAAALLHAWGVPQLAPHDLVAASDRLAAFLAERYPGAAVMHEWPVHAEVGAQAIRGRIDLLVDAPEGLVLVDHKSFPGAIDPEGERLASVAGQLALYARAVEAATGRSVVAWWMHQPVVGVVRRVVVG